MIEQLVHYVRVTLIAPEREVRKGKSKHVVSILLVVLRHVALDVATTVDLSAFEAEPDLSRNLARLARVSDLHSLLKYIV